MEMCKKERMLRQFECNCPHPCKFMSGTVGGVALSKEVCHEGTGIGVPSLKLRSVLTRRSLFSL